MGVCNYLILHSPPSVRPSVSLSPPKPLDEIHPNLVCELLTWMGCATANFFGPAPWGPGEWPKGQFQRFFNQTLCVFSHMKDIKYIRRDFHLVPWVMPKGSDLGVPWGVWGSIFFFFFEIQPDLVCELLTWMAHEPAPFFGSPPPWGLGEGPKGQISLNLNYKVNFKGFLTKLCVSSHKWKIYNISDMIFIRPPGSCPGVGLWGTVEGLGSKFVFSEIQPDLVCELLAWMAHAPAQFFGSPPPGALGRGQNLIFWTWSLKRMGSRPWYTERF